MFLIVFAFLVGLCIGFGVGRRATTTVTIGQLLGKEATAPATAAEPETELPSTPTPTQTENTMTQDEQLDYSHHQASKSPSLPAPVTLNNINNHQLCDVPDPNNSNNKNIECVCDRNDSASTAASESASLVVVVSNGNEIFADRPPDTPASPSDTDIVPTGSVVQTDDSASVCIPDAAKSSDIMTVITQQNSGENIRDIIETKLLEKPEKIVENVIVDNVAKKNEKNIEFEDNNNVVAPPIDDDPLVRLNKLRASISSALSEVKGVLRQYSTDKSFDEEAENLKSPDAPDDGVVRFRFVRKIRRRSQVADVEDVPPKEADKTDEQKPTQPDATIAKSSALEKIEEKVEVAVPEEKASLPETIQANLVPETKEPEPQDNTLEAPTQRGLEKIEETVEEAKPKPKKKILKKQASVDSDDSSTASQKTVKKVKKPKTDEKTTNNLKSSKCNGKPPAKASATGRRASIAAVEPSKIAKDTATADLKLVERRRPSDSGTIVKQPIIDVISDVKSDVGADKESASQSAVAVAVQPSTESIQTEPTSEVAISVAAVTDDKPSPEAVEDVENKTEAEAMTNGHTSDLKHAISGETFKPKEHDKENQPPLPNAPTEPAAKGTELALVPAPPLTVQIYVEPEVPEPFHVPKDDVAIKLKKEGKEVVAAQKEEEPVKEPSPTTASNKKRKSKRKVIIRRIKRKLSRDDGFHPAVEEAPPVTEVSEKDIPDGTANDEDAEEQAGEQPPEVRKPCLKLRQFEIGDQVQYGERYKKTMLKWKRAIVLERITSISYKLKFPDGEEKPAHISFIKKFTDRKVSFGGKEYLEIDYEQIEEDEEAERTYSIWNHV